MIVGSASLFTWLESFPVKAIANSGSVGNGRPPLDRSQVPWPPFVRLAMALGILELTPQYQARVRICTAQPKVPVGLAGERSGLTFGSC